MKSSDIIQLALSEVGYKGKKSNKDLYDKTANTSGKYTKYAKELYEANYYNGNKNGYDYCCVFVDWLFYKIAGSKAEADKVKPVGLYGAGVNYIKGMFPPDRISAEPSVGAQVLFKDSKGALCHTGIVTGFTNDTVTTVEGNLTGSIVGVKTYSRTDAYIDSFISPYYEVEPQRDKINDCIDKIAEFIKEALKEIRK